MIPVLRVHASYANHKWTPSPHRLVVPQPLDHYNPANGHWIVPLGFVFCFAWGLELYVTLVFLCCSFRLRTLDVIQDHSSGRSGFHSNPNFAIQDTVSSSPLIVYTHATSVSRVGILVVSSTSTSSEGGMVRKLGVSHVVHG